MTHELGTKIQIINLSPHWADCWICDETVILLAFGPNYGVAIYEDQIVPDGYRGPWGGAPVCKRCFDVVARLQAERPGQTLDKHIDVLMEIPCR